MRKLIITLTIAIIIGYALWWLHILTTANKILSDI